MNYLPIALALVLAGPAAAQQMYRCGSTFSQQPCGADAKAIDTPGVVQPRAAPADPAKVAAIKADCSSWVVTVPAWKDRDSVKVGKVVRGAAETRTVNGASRIVQVYYATANGKNAMGGYAGEKTMICYADEAAGKVVDLWQP